VCLAKSTELEPPFFRPWEILIRGSSTHFLPGRRVEMMEFGNLGYRNWIRALQKPHPTVFTTDAHGFRNAHDIERPRIVVIGNSFVVGIGLSDDETLPVRLSSVLGVPVYNFGAQFDHGPPLFLADRRFADAPPEIAIWAPSASTVRPMIIPERAQDHAEPSPLVREARAVFAAYQGIGDSILEVPKMLERDNGLSRWAKLSFHETSYALFGLEDQIVVDGQPALVESLEAQKLFDTPEQRQLDETVKSILWYQRALAARGTKLVIAPIPETGSIYPELFPEEDQRRLARPAFLDRLFEELAREGVPAIDLRPPLGKDRVPYLFLFDDTHWNSRCVQIAARAIAESLPR
jgi:hypothetical protein